MWRSILAVILLPSLTAAQVEVPATPQTTDSKPMYHSYTRLNQIRRGMKEDIAIELANIDYVAWPASPAANAFPIKLELEPTEGFTYTNFRFPKPYVQKFGYQPEHLVRVVDGWEPIQFSLRVGDTVVLGEHVLKGKLTFVEVADHGTATIPRQLDIQIPVTVVDHSVKLSKNYPWVGLSKGMIVLIVLLSPLLVLYFIGCGVTLASPEVCKL